MIDYVQGLVDDLPQQFREKEKIRALHQAIGRQFQEIHDFYEDLKEKRFITTAEGIQLDMIGQNLAISREEAKELFGTGEEVTDDEYRRILSYKATANYGKATYTDIVSCLRIIHGEASGYKITERPEHPATIIFETDNTKYLDQMDTIINTPMPKSAGVGVMISVKEENSFNMLVGITSTTRETREMTTDEPESDD